MILIILQVSLNMNKDTKVSSYWITKIYNCLILNVEMLYYFLKLEFFKKKTTKRQSLVFYLQILYTNLTPQITSINSFC